MEENIVEKMANGYYAGNKWNSLKEEDDRKTGWVSGFLYSQKLLEKYKLQLLEYCERNENLYIDDSDCANKFYNAALCDLKNMIEKEQF